MDQLYYNVFAAKDVKQKRQRQYRNGVLVKLSYLTSDEVFSFRVAADIRKSFRKLLVSQTMK